MTVSTSTHSYPTVVFTRSSITGVLESYTLIAPLVSSSKPATQRHFSSFPLTSHLHAPVLRLVSLHPSLAITLSFARVPEIHDGFEYKEFVSSQTIASEVIEAVIEGLGLSRSLPIPGASALEYVLEEVWTDGDEESTFIPHTPRLCFSNNDVM